MAQFDHHTSRESDPELHIHTFVFNLVPRRDGSCDAIISPELYKAQKHAGEIYRQTLSSELERQSVRLERQKDTFRVAAISRPVAPSRSGAKPSRKPHASTTTTRQGGMELATLRTPFLLFSESFAKLLIFSRAL
jgi:conjugative relaxase-like TrwC/TraI family protein